jgi:hypothetical protein
VLGVGRRAAVAAYEYLAARRKGTRHGKSRGVHDMSVFGKKGKAELGSFLGMLMYDLKSGFHNDLLDLVALSLLL